MGRNKNKIGFTLIELLVVISVLGLLAAIVSVSVRSARERSYYARAVADMSSIAKAAQMYLNDNGDYPPDVYTDQPTGLEPYLAPNVWPRGPWVSSYYDWDYWVDYATWATPGIPGDKIVQVSLRFCTTTEISTCNFPDLGWANGFVSRSSLYYCIEGLCRPHKNLVITAPGKCANC